MNVYVDGMFFRSTGVGRVFENLLAALLEQAWIDRIDTVVPAAVAGEFRSRFPDPRVTPLFVDYGPMSAGDFIRKSRALRTVAPRVPRFFFPGHDVPLGVPGPYTMTVHDLTVFSPHVRIHPLRKAGFRYLLARALAGAESVVTVSETTKTALIEEFSVPRQKITVIYNWIEDRFFAAPGDARTPGPAGGGDYLLYLGLRIAHKNLDGLLRAFSLVAGEFPRLRLVVAGTRSRGGADAIDRWRRDGRLAGRIEEVHDPADAEIARLFAGAKAFVFPSFAEGFGLPPLEAMAAGVPVVCSDIPVFREVYGDAVRYVDPARPGSIAEGIRCVLTEPGLAAGLSARGRARAALFRRERSLPAYLEVVRSGRGPGAGAGASE